MAIYDNDNVTAYRSFIEALKKAITLNEKTTLSQSKEFKKLLISERAFTRWLINIKGGPLVYQEFLSMIVDDNNNLLTGRAYFRKTLEVYTDKITSIFRKYKDNKEKKQNKNKGSPHRKLVKFHLNFKFICFTKDRYHGPYKIKLNKMFQRISDVRQKLCENNIPLALNRTNIFWNRSKYSKVEYMDLVQAAVEGLLQSIDKFVPERGEFRHVAISRITGNLIADQNQTDIAINQQDKRVLYRINLGLQLGLKGRQLLSFVKKSFPKVKNNDIIELLQASNNVQKLDDPIEASDEDSLTVGSTIADACNTEESLIKKDLYNKLHTHLNILTVLERKVIRLKYGL